MTEKKTTWVSRQELRTHWGVSDRTFQTYMNEGQVAHWKKGHTIMYSLEDAQKIIEIVKSTDAENKGLIQALNEAKTGYKKDLVEYKVNRRVLGRLESTRAYLTDICIDMLGTTLLDERLTPRDKQVVRLLLSGNTMEEVAETFELTKERVRQIVLRTSRRLDGYKGRIAELEAENKRLTERCVKLHMDIVNKSKNKGKKIEFSSELEKLWCAKITDEDFSVRTLNCLVIGLKLKTIGDLLRTPKDMLMRVNGCGKKSLAEIEAYLAEHGVEWDEYEDKEWFNRHIAANGKVNKSYYNLVERLKKRYNR